MPNSNFVGSDSFTFKANDGSEDSNTATFTITVSNSAPTASDGSDGLHANSSLSSAVSFSDPDMDSVTASVVTTTSNGTLTFNSDGSFSYTPNPNFVGSDSFTFKANDGVDDSDAATFTITVSNVAPSANNGTETADKNATLNASVSASDADMDSLTFSLVTGPSNGALTLNSDGTFTYTPNTDFIGTDSFVFKANDGITDSPTAVQTISVNDAANADGMTGWSITGPTGTVYLDQTDGNVLVSGVRGNNPDGKVVTLEIWDVNDFDAESPMLVFTIDDGVPGTTDDGVPGSTWSVSFAGTAGSYTAELHWDTIQYQMFNDPRSLSFDVENNGGDPIP